MNTKLERCETLTTNLCYVMIIAVYVIVITYSSCIHSFVSRLTMPGQQGGVLELSVYLIIHFWSHVMFSECNVQMVKRRSIEVSK